MHMLVLFYCDVRTPFLGNLFVLHFGAPLPKKRCCPKVIEVPHQDESFSSQINPLSHFKCLIGRAPSMLWIASWTEIRFSQIRFSLGDSKLNRITFHWNPGRGTPKTCQESNPQKLTDDGSVVFCCPFKPNHLDTWCWGKVLLQPRPIIICNYMAWDANHSCYLMCR